MRKNAGRLVRAVRNNASPGIPFDIPVVETYEYRGALGQLSQQKTWVENLHGTSEAIFTQSMAYDPTGQKTSHTYPACTGFACTGTDDLPAPAHTVSTTYRSGFPTQVSSSRGPWGNTTYHPNFQIASQSTSNQVTGTFDSGTNGMVRPQRLRYQGSHGVLYDSGTFEYDELGNIHQIGDDVYRYDKASRLTYGTVSRAGSRWEAYQYDIFDNMIERQGESDPTPFPIHVDPLTNRALGDGDIEYDAHGNLTKVGPPSFTMSYDALDMQVHFEQHFGNPTEYLYAYGPGDRRILTFEVPTGKLIYQLRGPGGEVLREYEVLGSGGAAFEHTKDLIHGPDGLIATISRDGDEHYFHKDHLGTPRAVTDHAGVRTGKHDYYPYGQETPNSPQHPDQTVKWTGHQRDLHGFSDYMMGRTCLYPLRRFASVDPARDGWNLYT